MTVLDSIGLKSELQRIYDAAAIPHRRFYVTHGRARRRAYDHPPAMIGDGDDLIVCRVIARLSRGPPPAQVGGRRESGTTT